MHLRMCILYRWLHALGQIIYSSFGPVCVRTIMIAIGDVKLYSAMQLPVLSWTLP